MKTKDHKIIFACDKQGLVQHLYLDSGALLKNIELPIELHRLVVSDDLKKLEHFWRSITENGMEYQTYLKMSINTKKLRFKCSGYVLNETILIGGHTETTAQDKALEAIMRINNEQANQIRRSEKKIEDLQKEVEKQGINDAFLNDFSTLNNELINNKRELIHKNQKIEVLNKELNEANKHMRLFTYSVSHDLKEPLRMMTSFLSLLQKKYSDRLDQKGQNYMDFAVDGANRLSKMMEDLLKYHQSPSNGKLESVDLNAVIVEVKTILQKEITEKKAEITNSKLPIVEGSYTGFIQIFQNLISNALKFIPEERTPMITIDFKDDYTHYTVMVKDNGIGISENQKQDVFNLFKRLNAPQQYEGSGVGLAMVKKSVKRIGGDIWLESEVDKGTSFFFNIKKNPAS